MSYTDVLICIGPLPFLETWPPIYRGQERTMRDRLKSQVNHHVYFQYTPCLTDFTFEFIRCPIPPILSPSSRTFVELTLVNTNVPNTQLIAKPITFSEITAGSFEVSPGLLNRICKDQFGGSTSEDASMHLHNFVRYVICKSLKILITPLWN
jgi:hypothetical protein